MGHFEGVPTAEDVLAGRDLTGVRALVTGASAGIGLETVRVLAAHGAHVTGAVRNLEKARAAASQVGLEIGDRFALAELDLASIASVRRGADALLAAGAEFDLVIANAGLMAYALARTADGVESTLATNFLGHFVLVNRLAQSIRRGGRIVMVSSIGHRFADIDFDDINFERRPFTPLAAYGAAKTAEILFAVEFDRRHRARGVRATALHPGAVGTDLAATMPPEVGEEIYSILVGQGATPESFTLKTLAQGAATTLWAAIVAPADAVGGRYCEDCGVAAVAAHGATGVQPYALDPDRAARLWTLAAGLVAESYAV